VLVAIMNSNADFKFARDQHWYRIPVGKAEKWGRHHWPPAWLAFYQTQLFKDEGCQVKYYARVHDIRIVERRELFPLLTGDKKADRLYYRLQIGPLHELPRPIKSLRLRRIAFIPTTWQKLWAAEEINDLWDGSPLEDELWTELKQTQLRAERQEFVRLKRKLYALDFAFHCTRGKLNVEADGDLWHSNPRRIAEDNRRDNALETAGWRLLRFNTTQLREQMADYCLPTIQEVVDDLGGLAE
jgi:very-short-patch-repair endonuclease